MKVIMFTLFLDYHMTADIELNLYSLQSILTLSVNRSSTVLKPASQYVASITCNWKSHIFQWAWHWHWHWN